MELTPREIRHLMGAFVLGCAAATLGMIFNFILEGKPLDLLFK